jgi:hypothetical protein
MRLIRYPKHITATPAVNGNYRLAVSDMYSCESLVKFNEMQSERQGRKIMEWYPRFATSLCMVTHGC